MNVNDESAVPAENPVTPAARRKARRFALQSLYTWQISGEEPHAVEAYYRAENDMRKTDVAYFHELFVSVVAQSTVLEEAFAGLLDRPVKDIDPIERNILRIAAYELQHRLDVPVRVVVNEGIELAKEFGATDDSYKFVNGVLDKLARRARAAEFSAR
ncbi:MAG: transcription antitermination factor NusB [Pseudomonadota bacterium]